MHACAGRAHQLDQRQQGNRLGGHRHADRPASCHAPLAATPWPARHPAPQPHGVAEVAAYCSGAQQHQRVTHRPLRPARSRRTGLVSSAISVSTSRSRPALARRAGTPGTTRACARGISASRPAGFVQCGSVSAADQAGHAACGRRDELALEHALVLMARLAQPRRKVDQSGRRRSAGVDAAVGLKSAVSDRCRRCGRRDGHVGARRAERSTTRHCESVSSFSAFENGARAA